MPSFRANADNKICIYCETSVPNYAEEICAINSDCMACEFMGDTDTCAKQSEPANVPLCMEHRV